MSCVAQARQTALPLAGGRLLLAGGRLPLGSTSECILSIPCFVLHGRIAGSIPHAILAGLAPCRGAAAPCRGRLSPRLTRILSRRLDRYKVEAATLHNLTNSQFSTIHLVKRRGAWRVASRTTLPHDFFLGRCWSRRAPQQALIDPTSEVTQSVWSRILLMA